MSVTPAAVMADAVPARLGLGRAAQLRSVLQDEIESGALPPGALLDERALAARFEVSRTPVREALQQLAVHGLVRIAPRQGVTVARLSVARVRAMLEFITEGEALAAKLAARRADAELARQLDAALQRCQEAAQRASPAEYALANSLFHEVVYAGCRNPHLAEQLRSTRRMVSRYRPGELQTAPQLARSLADHGRIARAIQAGDEALAAAHMLAHLPLGTSGFSEFLARVPASFFDTEDGSA
jgi:DNA-binding GntR family transcriptional regulator